MATWKELIEEVELAVNSRPDLFLLFDRESIEQCAESLAQQGFGFNKSSWANGKFGPTWPREYRALSADQAAQYGLARLREITFAKR
jgi:hypothetical protein